MSSAIAPQSSFRKQLITTVTIGILALALITSLTTAWITSAKIYEQMLEDGLQVTNTVAKQSVLSLLYDSGDNSEDAFNAAMGFPAITHVELKTLSNRTLLSKGTNKNRLPSFTPSESGEAALIKEDSEEWIFAAPVYSEGQIESIDSAIALLQTEKAARELLGSVIVIKSKAGLKQTVTATITNNLLITVVIAIILLIIVRRSFSRLIKPLSELSLIMARAEQGDTNAYATLQGPREVHNIGRAFNKMMEALAERDAQLRRHNELLEYEVSQRTQELVYARDMAIQANQNKSDFLSRVSHELRTPLQSILGYSDLITEDLPPEMENIHRDINTIITNANHLLNMINSVLDMSKVESGQMHLSLTQTDLRQVINGVIATTAPLLQNNRNRLETEIKLQDQSLMIDEAKLRQIILNLLSNAIKFTEAGLIELKATQTTTLLHLRIKDSGIGIQESQLEHIFDPFYQIESSNTRRFQGTGLGLAISHQFCKLMGGSIRVSSEYNKGSIFDIDIPLPIKETGEYADL